MASDSYFMGVDVGTGSARVCLIDAAGVIKGIHSKDTKTWNPRANFYVRPHVEELVVGGPCLTEVNQEQSTSDIWSAISECSKKVLADSGVDPKLVRGIGFDATCSLVVFDKATDEPISVAGPDFKDTTRNVIRKCL